MASYDNKVLKGDQLITYTQKVKEALAQKQATINAENKLSYSYIKDTPTIPTDNSQLQNGAGYQTASQVETAIAGKGYQTAEQVQTAITSAVGGIQTFKFQIVENLPVTGASNIIYLKLKATGTEGNVYTEYAYISDKWEIIGDTAVTLDFLTNTEIQQIWSDAQ